MPEDLALPAALAEVAEIGFDQEWDGLSEESWPCDFKLYQELEALEETNSWLSLWTGNDEVDGRHFRFFGTTGAGDYVGFWLVRPIKSVTKQPVVYFDSEGDLDVVARDLDDLLWLFANGAAPLEAVGNREYKTIPNEAFRAIAEKYAPGKSRSTAEIVTAAQKEFPNFAELIHGICQ